ncbi:MAG: PKD domain-containing protein, partial [Bacteroidota bacterium]
MQRLLLLLICFLVPFAGWSQTADVTSGCAPLEVSFTAPAGVGSFFWDFQDGTISSTANPINTFTNPGTYMVEFRETTTGPVIGTVTIEVFDTPTINIMSDVQSGCAPLTVTFTADPDLPVGATITNYEWVFGNGTAVLGEANPTVTFEDAGSFFVSLNIETDLSGCTNTVVFDDFIEVTPGPTAAFDTDQPDLASCTSPFTIQFSNASSGQAPFDYQWDFGNGNTATNANPPAQTYVDNGNYDVQFIVTDASGCSDTTETQVSVGVPLASFQMEQPLCVGSNVEIINESTQGQYSWNFGPNASPATAGGISPNVTFNDEGSFDVTLTVTVNSTQCQDDTTVTVVVDRVDATVSSTPTFSCDQPLTVDFTANTNEAQSFFWEFADGTTSNQQNPSHTFFTPSDSFSVNELEVLASTVTITNPSGCAETFTVRDTIFRPNALFHPDITQGCAPLTVVFSDSSTSSDPISTWEWDFGDGTTQTENNDNPVSHTFNTPGEYDVRLRIENALGCQDTSYAITISVGDVLTPNFTVDQTTVCQGESVQFTDLTNDPNIDAWHYETEDGRSFHCFQSGDPSWAYEGVVGPQDVTLIVEYNGCFSEVTQSGLITVNGPVAQLDYLKTCDDPFTVAFADSSLDATSVSWDFGDGSGSNQDDPTHTYGTSGNYLVTLTAENPATGCPASTDTATVYIRDIEAVIDIEAFLCQDATVTLDGSSSQDVNVSCSKGYTWYFSDPDLRPMTYEEPTADMEFSTPGSQTVQLVVEDINGCRDTASQQIRVFSIDVDFLQDQTQICLPNDVSFTDTTVGDTTIVNWDWSFGDGNTSMNQNPTNTYIAPNPDGYTITLIAMDAIGCTDSISKPLELYSPESMIVSNPTPANICVGQNLELSATDFSGGGSFLNFSWDLGNGQTANDSTVTANYSASGTYEVVMTFVEDGTGCTGSDTLEVNVQDFPIPGFASNTDTLPILCFPQNILFTDTSTGVDIMQT